MKITKKFKGVLSIALSAILTLGSITANATTTNGKEYPQVNPEQDGSITIHKYVMDSMPESKNASGLEISNENNNLTDLPEEAIPLANVSFNIYKVDNETTSTNQITNENKGNPIKTITTGDSGDELGIATTGKLPVGVYYVEEVKDGAIVESVEPFLVSIPMAHPTENEWIYDVHVYPKNVVEGVPKIDKFVNEEDKSHTANINEEITWTITPQIPRGIATAKEYIISDKLDSRLTYTGFVGVSFIDASGNKIKLNVDEDYKVLTTLSENNETILKVVFEKSGMQKLATALVDGEELPTVKIQFKTVINETADLGVPIYNNATLTYKNSVDQESSTDVPGSGNKEPEVQTGGLLLEKVDAADSNIKLGGAKFKIYPSLVDAQNGTNAILNPENNKEEWEVTTVKTEENPNGQAIFRGLAYGTYYIVETVAPKYDSNGDGQITDADKSYNILSKPFEVTVSAESHLESNKIVVANSKFKLPVTGGVGTVIFTLGGLAIMGAAAFLYMRTTRRA